MCAMANIRTKHSFHPRVLGQLSSLGMRISASRRLQRLRQEDLAGMAGIGRSTLVEIEKGSPFVAMGNYMSVLLALGLFDEAPPEGESDVLLPGVTSGMTADEQKLVVHDLPKRVRHG